ncbi:metal transporter Nramp5-like [Zingiber officinale]|uniref:metal transporter Nramp5-like n=1 Tax=Zingiber officinale TaxID=94328 RepID=UPI001C4AABA7|nr:metal transporter Nramp5-like [Zingiber officinale]
MLADISCSRVTLHCSWRCSSTSQWSVSGSVCASTDLSAEDSNRCNDLTLNSASLLLKNVLGKSSSIIYGISLLASSQSSTITGFSRHQNENMVAKLCDSMHRNLSQPFCSHYRRNSRIREAYNHSIDDPLLRVVLRPRPSPQVQQQHHQDGASQEFYLHNCVSWVLGLGVIGINIYYFSTSFVTWIIHSSFPKPVMVLIGVMVFPVMAFYVISLIYLMFKKDRMTRSWRFRWSREGQGVRDGCSRMRTMNKLLAPSFLLYFINIVPFID